MAIQQQTQISKSAVLEMVNFAIENGELFNEQNWAVYEIGRIGTIDGYSVALSCGTKTVDVSTTEKLSRSYITVKWAIRLALKFGTPEFNKTCYIYIDYDGNVYSHGMRELEISPLVSYVVAPDEQYNPTDKQVAYANILIEKISAYGVQLSASASNIYTIDTLKAIVEHIQKGHQLVFADVLPTYQNTTWINDVAEPVTITSNDVVKRGEFEIEILVSDPVMPTYFWIITRNGKNVECNPTAWFYRDDALQNAIKFIETYNEGEIENA